MSKVTVLSSLTILPWDSRFPGQSHGLMTSNEHLTVNEFTSWCINYFGIILFLRIQQPSPLSFEGLNTTIHKVITILVKMADLEEERTDSDADYWSISRFLLKSPGFETSASSFMVPWGWEVWSSRGVLYRLYNMMSLSALLTYSNANSISLCGSDSRSTSCSRHSDSGINLVGYEKPYCFKTTVGLWLANLWSYDLLFARVFSKPPFWTPRRSWGWGW